ncbi:hypothetical protein ACFQBP_40360, partial [Paraburkholderia dipogonis]
NRIRASTFRQRLRLLAWNPLTPFLPRSTQTPAGSTAAHTEADPVASRAGRQSALGVAGQVKERV